MHPKKIVAVLALLPIILLTASHAASAANSQRQLKIVSLQAFKFQGYQPLDVMAQVTDELDAPVSDADVVIALPSGSDLRLKATGKGMYIGCDIAYLDGPAKQVVVTASANKKGSKGANATTRANVGNLCGEGEPQMFVQDIKAGKLDGKGQPLSVRVRIVDEMGRAVLGAKVLARATDYHIYFDGPLTEEGNGYYSSCAFGSFDTKGAGAISIHVRVERPGFREGAMDASNTVGTFCTSDIGTPADTGSSEALSRALSSAPRRAN